jgi:hypothetical protein
MKRVIKQLLMILSLIAPTVTFANITYTFDFTNIHEFATLDQNPKPDFSLTLTYPGFVTGTYMFPIRGGPLPTTLGFPVIYAGTNTLGWWGFEDNTAANAMNSQGYTYYGGSFLFLPAPFATGYVTTLGTFEGTVMGNDIIPGFNGYAAFNGDATLTISGTAVPEPSTAWLFAFGLVGVLVARRRNSGIARS